MDRDGAQTSRLRTTTKTTVKQKHCHCQRKSRR